MSKRFVLEPDLLSISCHSRRTLLKASLPGTLGILPQLTKQSISEATEPSKARKTACVVFFLDGGPSHHDTFDPKPSAPAEVRGEFSTINTTVPGIEISDQLPQLAKQAHQYSIIRSLYHDNPSHAPAEHQMLTGWMGSRPGTARAVIEKPSLGSVVASQRGTRVAGMPAYVAIPWSFHHAYGGSPFGAASYLGPRFEPFESGHPPNSITDSFEVPGLRLLEDLSDRRLLARKDLLNQIDHPDHQHASAKRLSTFADEALHMLVSDQVRSAFDLSKESKSLRERYGAHEWGQGALLSRRLIESGVTFIMLQCGLRQDWDTHSKNFPRLKDTLLPAMDRAVSSLLEDLSEKGLLDDTLVLVMGEFGRTPVVNKSAGRDHWASVFSALMAGGSIQSGQVIGASDKTGAYPNHRPEHARNLFATMYQGLGIDFHKYVNDQQGRPIPVLGNAKPIQGLF